MPPKKKTKLAVSSADTAVGNADISEIDQLSDDTVAMIFSHFGPSELMRMRCVCKKWTDVAKKTIPAPVNFHVHSVNKFRAVVTMTTALPNVQNIELSAFFLPPRDEGGCIVRPCSRTDRYADGEDPDDDEEDDQLNEEAINVTTHDINIISRFSKLRHLKLSTFIRLNGRYPALFNFPLLQHLQIDDCDKLKCDLSMLAGLPSLKVLDFTGLDKLTGDLESLIVLRDDIEEVSIHGCPKVTGEFIILADFPRLKRLDLNGTAVTGDIRDIGDNHFLRLEYLLPPDTAFGGRYHEFQLVSEVPRFMDTVAPILRRFANEDWCWLLSEESPDWYENHHSIFPEPPFIITFVKAGPRVGWRWGSEDPEDREWAPDISDSCEINWLDPEPQRDSFGSNEEYEKYADELKSIEERIRFYQGYHQPPTQDEYRFRCWEGGIQLAHMV